MPPNRPDREREEKIEEILDAAEAQLLAGGYSAMSVAAIARRLRIAANTIYWYFPSKDRLLVAVLDRLMRRVVERKPPHAAGLVRQALYFVDQLAEFRAALLALRERAGQSQEVADFEAHFRFGVRTMLTSGLQAELPAREAVAAAEAFGATVEGALALNLPKKERDRVLTLVLRRLMSGAG